MIELAKRTQKLKAASIWSLFEEVVARKERGEDVIDMTIGAPSHPMFKEAHEAAHKAIDSGMLERYTTVDGTRHARETVAAFANLRYGETVFEASNVMLTTASTQGLYNVLSIMVDEGDVVLITRPCYPLYAQPIEIHGGEVMYIETSKENGFVPTAQQVEDAFRRAEKGGKSRVKVVILDYPNNPSGATLSEENAKTMAAVLDKMFDTYNTEYALMMDDVYIGLADDVEHSIYHWASQRLREHTYFVLSGSKSLALPGARIGAVITHNKDHLYLMRLLQAGVTNNPNGVAQEALRASLQAFIDGKDTMLDVAKGYAKKREYVAGRLNAIAQKFGANKMPVEKVPGGALYVLVDMSFMIGQKLPSQFASALDTQTIRGDEDIARYFIAMAESHTKAGVASVPGSGFDLDPKEGFLRFTCTADMPVLERAMKIIEEAVHLIKEENAKAA